jgi:hypothetical protein
MNSLISKNPPSFLANMTEAKRLGNVILKDSSAFLSDVAQAIKANGSSNENSNNSHTFQSCSACFFILFKFLIPFQWMI